MTPLEFLNVEFENVSLALRETLRHDYGPRLSEGYYQECQRRLADIKTKISAVSPTDAGAIRDLLLQLMRVASFVALIERSRLGEFSWPFADELRRIAIALFSEKDLKGDLLEPIIHIISDGEGYRIINEARVAAPSSRQRFLIISFPPSLKRHVLLHALFGHEVGHTAAFINDTVAILDSDVLPALVASSPLRDVATMNAWIHRSDADASVKSDLAAYKKSTGQDFSFAEKHRMGWIVELICDLVGTLLFGPAFLAAHHTYLKPLQPEPYGVGLLNPTHPPFAIRHKMLVQVMRSAGWSNPITSAGDGVFHEAEELCLTTLMNDPYAQWAQFFTDGEIGNAIAGARKLFQAHPWMGYVPSSSLEIISLLKQLVRGNPPVLAALSAEGVPSLARIRISQTLYAGWVYWIGRQHLSGLKGHVPLDFMATNLLCDRALLQQRAIDMTLDAGVS